MRESGEIRKIVEKAVAEALESQLPQLREALVERVLQSVSAQLGDAPAASPAAASSDAGSAPELQKAVSAVHAGTTQKEILRALLDGSARFSGRTALFVVKGGAAIGWQGHGFADDDAIKDFSLDVSAGPVAQVVHSRHAVSGSAAEIDAHFISQFGAPGDGTVVVLPLLLKEKIAALIYADGGKKAGGHLDAASLEVLVTSTGAWLEAVSLRKQTQRDGGDQDSARQDAAPVQTVSSYSDPFAAHAPAYSAAAAHAGGGNSTGHAAAAAAALSPEEADAHNKAQRFARLLVDEIKLYNQVKVTEGRKNRDLYDRLKPDIEKSRSMYLKRYGNTVDNGADYFSTELVRSLAEDDSSLMGANFRR